jgi:hypothetical protein
VSTDSTILKAALEAKTAADFGALEALLAGRMTLKWRPVGDMEDNFGAINAASDARLALNERITNMIDAQLELHARLKYGTDVASMVRAMASPAQAATVLLGVPAAGVGELSISDRQKLAEDISISFLESGVAERPTAVLRDNGIGQTPSRLADTILSIHRGNKRDKPFLMGMYGWGGASALCFAEGGTVVVSRRHPELLDGEPDGVAVTIVKKIYTQDMRTPAYFYAVDSNNEVLSLDVSAADEVALAHGTQITHIEYDLAIKGPLVNQYKYYNSALYEPVVPYYLGSNRDIDKTPGRRTMVGVGGRLKSRDDDSAKGTKIAYSNRATIDLGDDGEVKVHIWVLDKDGIRPGADTTSAFVDADSAIVVTLNGQRQDSEKREWIKRVCKYPHLFTRMIVEVEADHLSQEAKIRAFASTRERLRGTMHDRIFKELADLLVQDTELQRLQETLREESLKDTASKASEKDLKKLAKIIGKLGGRTAEVDVKVEVEADGEKTKGGGGGGTPRSTDDSLLPGVPTKLEFAPHVLTVIQGGTKKRLMVNIDAKNGYLPDHDADLTIVVDGPTGETKAVFPTTRAQMLGGMAQWLVAATEDAELGDYKLIATLKVPGGELSDSVAIAVIAPREPSEGGSSRTGEKKSKKVVKQQVPVGPQVSWVEREKWDTYGFDARSVGKVDASDKGVDIYLNLDFDKLHEVLSNPSYTSAVQEARKSAYMIPTALGLYRVQEMEQKNELSEDIVKETQLIVADSVLVATDTEGILGETIDDDD